MSQPIVDSLGNDSSSLLLSAVSPKDLAGMFAMSMEQVDAAYRKYFNLMEDSGSIEEITSRVQRLFQHHTANSTDVKDLIIVLERLRQAQENMELAVHNFCMIRRALQVRQEEVTQEVQNVLAARN